MFKVSSSQIIAKKPWRYLSFPDIIQSIHNKNKYFLVYREGDAHHPISSKLVLMMSDDQGATWEVINQFGLNLDINKRVWNCPRLSYNANGDLCIICDTKDNTFEVVANFKTFLFTGYKDSVNFNVTETTMPGMLPDKFVPFKGKLFCANHKIKYTGKHDLVQLVSWSRDGGATWYDTNLLADDRELRFCEASIVNVKDEYLIAYIRENSGHKRHLYTSTSKDGIKWSKPKPINNVYGQRPSAIYYKGNVICSYRNTDSAKLSIFYHDLKKDTVKVGSIDSEKISNLYNFGYSGIAAVSNNEFLVVYYITNKEKNPFIKLARVKKDARCKN